MSFLIFPIQSLVIETNDVAEEAPFARRKVLRRDRAIKHLEEGSYLFERQLLKFKLARKFCRPNDTSKILDREIEVVLVLPKVLQ